MPAPVRHTCPDIDKVIKLVKSALSTAKEGMNITERHSDEYVLFDAIETELWGVEDKLEELRSANDALRKWGHELEERIDELENELSTQE